MNVIVEIVSIITWLALIQIALNNNYPLWQGVVPPFNLFVLLEIVSVKKKMALLFIIPGINLLFLMFIGYKIAYKYDRGKKALIISITVPISLWYVAFFD